MNPYAVLVISVLISHVSPTKHNIQIIRKCCAKGQQLSTDTKSCVSVKGLISSNDEMETFYPPITVTDSNWLPNQLRSNILKIHYKTLPNVLLDVSMTYSCNNGTLKIIRDSPRKIDKSLISIVRFCYDSTPNISRVLVKGVRLKTIHKCCSKTERLNSKATQCEPQTNYQRNNMQHETNELSEHQWLPGNSTEYFLKIKYNLLESGYRFTTVVPVNTEFKWRILKSEPTFSTVISFQGRNMYGNPVSDTTDIFCFDEVGDGPFTSRVLLAGGFHVPKCCGKGEELNDGASACTVRKGRSRDKDKCDVLDAANDVDRYWLPQMFQGRVPVRYEMIFKMSLHSSQLSVIGNEDAWRMRKDNMTDFSQLIIADSTLQEISVEEMHYCFDYLKDYGRVVVMHHPNDQNSFVQENSREEILLRYVCDKETEKTLPVANMFSMNRTFRQPIQNESVILPVEIYCKQIHSNVYDGYSADSLFQKLFQQTEWWTAETNVKKIVPSCSFSNLRSVAGIARQVGGTAAAVLAAAAAILVAVGKTTRSSAHGRALCCHAICLSFYTALQVASFYHKPTQETSCTPYMYFVYFFMMSSYFWLTAITINIYLTFRKPLGELALTPSKAPKEMRKRFIMLSLLGWGGGVLFTAFTVTMHQLKRRLRPMDITTPTFFESLTCEYEFEFSMDEDNGSFMFANQYAVVSYHCGPMGLLAVIDAVFLLLITRHMHKLRKGRSVLHSRRSSEMYDNARNLPPFWESALLYAKLLMVSGIADVCIGAASWATNLQEFRFYVLDETIVLSKHKAYKYTIINNAVDLIRALCVFWMSTGKLWKREQLREWSSAVQQWKRVTIEKMMKYKEGAKFRGSGWTEDVRKSNTASDVPLTGFWRKISFK